MKKHIALVTPSLKSGGAEKVAAQLSCFLSDLYDIYIFVADGSNPNYRYTGEVIEIGNDPHTQEYYLLRYK